LTNNSDKKSYSLFINGL